MKKLFLTIALLSSFIIGDLYAQDNTNCTTCNNAPPITDKSFRSRIGLDNNAEGYYSFVGGQNSTTIGKRSFAFGNNVTSKGINSIAFGSSSTALGDNSFSFGTAAISIGTGTFALGTRVEAKYNGGFVIGSGPLKGNLVNNQMQSMVIGFNSINPTLFISRSPNTSEPFIKTGRVGIGNVTDPQAKLHIRADEGESATLYLQPSNWNAQNNAKIFLGNTQNGISAVYGEGLYFNTEDNYLFNQGNLGIGTSNPSYNLDVTGSINFTGNIYKNGAPLTLSPWVQNGNHLYYENGKVGINTTTFVGDYGLYVGNGILTNEVMVKHPSQWFDHVFEEDYKNMSIDELEIYIKKNKHLPDIPSAKEVEENGINLGEMDALLLKKIEELTLYIIEQQKAIEKQDTDIKELQLKLNTL